ncbi:MAG TPA: bifunctional DNA-formamidopyrimidine glycosylase/DNA-(apurinic or apyrimidinic site) lyase [Bryobacteraceae bacterium]|nr:bifunctional DNA-formamidopyrimidine glycosylase/DNA-(apurinic or apyrimidinic site) lyase [Bryobacteraceae bacterium]HPT27218.1 bifunctional DNA-formamidopyrimidine glycosylase/DNA-(apurinic or apyrimidinic site) lyase [Bryobacteraceae bacterium]
MPELPEVEVVVRTLRPHITGRRITAFESLSPRAASPELGPSITGQTVTEVRRHGKYILIDLDRNRLAIHLRMTGKLLVAGPSTHPRAIIHLGGSAVVFDDIRQFGSIQLLAPGQLPPNLGPDLLALSPSAFAESLAVRKGAIKPLLLDQSVVAGLGNIYVDEALFRARIHPLAKPVHLSLRRLKDLHLEAVGMMEEAIAAGGSSISDYVNALGVSGSFQLRHAVYGRQDRPCPVCSAPVRKIVVAQRGTHFCPRCQRLR